jgi:hypothetical protein
MHDTRIALDVAAAVAVVATALGLQIHLIGFVLGIGSVVGHDVPLHSGGIGSPPFLLGNTQKEL